LVALACRRCQRSSFEQTKLTPEPHAQLTLLKRLAIETNELGVFVEFAKSVTLLVHRETALVTKSDQVFIFVICITTDQATLLVFLTGTNQERTLGFQKMLHLSRSLEGVDVI